MSDMKTKKLITSRGLPKTGQTTVYETGDDGTYQSGWWSKKTVDNNKTRFVARTIDGVDVIIDRATGLMWIADGDITARGSGNPKTWVQAIQAGHAESLGNWTNWRIPNLHELLTLNDYTLRSPMLATDLFVNTPAGGVFFWSSTTNIASITAAMVTSPHTPVLRDYAKTDSSDCYMMVCRSMK